MRRVYTIGDLDKAYNVGIQHSRLKLGGADELSPVSLRVTTIFRREDDGWRIVPLLGGSSLYRTRKQRCPEPPGSLAIPARLVATVGSVREDSGGSVSRERRSKLVDEGDGAASQLDPTVTAAPTEVPLDPSPELTPEKALDSALDRLLDLRPVRSQARG
jgi:hypothetical protein